MSWGPYHPAVRFAEDAAGKDQKGKVTCPRLHRWKGWKHC